MCWSRSFIYSVRPALLSGLGPFPFFPFFLLFHFFSFLFFLSLLSSALVFSFLFLHVCCVRYQVWNEEDAEDEVLAMVVRTGLRTTVGNLMREVMSPAHAATLRKDIFVIVCPLTTSLHAALQLQSHMDVSASRNMPLMHV